MIEKLNIADYHIPDGILHDQKLEKVTFDKENEKLIFTFNIRFFSDYVSNKFLEPYKDFTKCEMICKLRNDGGIYDFDHVLLETVFNKKLRYSGCQVSVDEFIECVNCTDEVYYLTTYISPDIRIAIIDFDLRYPKHKKYKKYGSARVNIRVNEIEYNWQ